MSIIKVQKRSHHEENNVHNDNDNIENDNNDEDENDDDNEIIDDWGLAFQNSNFQLFAQHEIRTVYITGNRNVISTTDNNNESCKLLINKEYTATSATATTTTTTTAKSERVITSSSNIEPSLCTKSSSLFDKFYILCVESLTPIDMIDLSNGIHDATCHCVWTGAFLLIAALGSSGRDDSSTTNHHHHNINHSILHPYFFPSPTTIQTIYSNNTVDSDQTKVKNHKTDIKSKEDDTTRCPIRVLELGCGTGISSIGIWTVYQKQYEQCCHNNNNNNIVIGDNSNETTTTAECTASSCQSQVSSSSPSTPIVHITMTDADPEALNLCRRNCELNHMSTNSYKIQSLVWGETLSSNTMALQYDIVIATDVLYDITLLPLLLQTAYGCLCYDGYFILSHVPRACYSSTHPPVSNLNDYIIQCATTQTHNIHGDDDTDTTTGSFVLDRIIHPNDIIQLQSNFVSLPKDALNSMSLQEMDEIGAKIFIFSKTRKTETKTKTHNKMNDITI